MTKQQELLEELSRVAAASLSHAESVLQDRARDLRRLINRIGAKELPADRELQEAITLLMNLMNQLRIDTMSRNAAEIAAVQVLVQAELAELEEAHGS